jgi:hypothetical protein
MRVHECPVELGGRMFRPDYPAIYRLLGRKPTIAARA